MSNTAAITLPCTAGGRTIITWNICSVRTDGDNDSSQWRIERRSTTQPYVFLRTAPQITMTSRLDTKSWTWIDDDIQVSGNYTYVLQVRRTDGEGTVNLMTLTGQHFKK